MANYTTASHSRYYIRYHIVWIVKYRKELLIEDPIVKRTVEILYDIGEKYELSVEEVGTDEDHLHLFCRGLQTVTPARVVEIYHS